MNARDVAIRSIAAHARRFPDLDISGLQPDEALDPRDAALASAINHAVRSRWLTLESVIQSQVSRSWEDLEPKMQAVLLAGAAQLLLLDRIPDHAILNESVEWAKRRIRPKAAGIVNAVLRKIAGLRRELARVDEIMSIGPDQLPLSDGRVWMLAEPIFNHGLVRRIAQQTSHVESLIAHWFAAFGEKRMLELAFHSLVSPPIVCHGIDDPTGLPLVPHEEPKFFIFEGDRAQLSELLAHHPQAIVQDPTSARVVHATSGLSPSPRLIMDVCAGRGTKTRQLAKVHPESNIVATDINDARLEALWKQFEGHPQVQVIDHEQLRSAEWSEMADLLLLDVPCSNSGVLPRRVEAKYRYSGKSMRSVIDLQRQILADSIALLAPKGRLLYATCSIDPAENQQQAEWICKWHRMRIVQSHSQMPEGLPGQPSSSYRDGGYFALLERA